MSRLEQARELIRAHTDIPVPPGVVPVVDERLVEPEPPAAPEPMWVWHNDLAQLTVGDYLRGTWRPLLAGVAACGFVCLVGWFVWLGTHPILAHWDEIVWVAGLWPLWLIGAGYLVWCRLKRWWRG